MPNAARSLSFDRAAEYYDTTRGRSSKGVERETTVLADALEGRGKVLEVGVGTGQVALPLHAAGVPMAGVDLSAPMLGVLREKAGGSSPFPLVLADATRMPFADATFGGAVLRWVLHLIPEWERAVDEIVRVVRPGGVAAMTLGGGEDGPREAIQTRFAELAGVDRRPRGLDWHGDDELDAAMAARGAVKRELPVFTDEEIQSVADYMSAIDENVYSWTWPLDDAVRMRVAAEVRAWAEAEFGPLEAIPQDIYEVRWRAYDLP